MQRRLVVIVLRPAAPARRYSRLSLLVGLERLVIATCVVIPRADTGSSIIRYVPPNNSVINIVERHPRVASGKARADDCEKVRTFLYMNPIVLPHV